MKTGIAQIQEDIQYLTEVSGCTKLEACVALINNGRMKGSFNSKEIQEITGLTSGMYEQAERSAMFKIRREFHTLDIKDLYLRSQGLTDD